MLHIDDRKLDAYATGLLSEPLLAEAEEHLLVCPECQQRLVQHDEFVALFREAVQEPATSRARGWNLWPWSRTAAWAGALAAVVLAIVLPLQRSQGPPATIMLQSFRADSTLTAKSRQPLHLVFDVPSTDAGQVRIVDRTGKSVVDAPSESEAGVAVAKVSGLARGAYWVRIYAKKDPTLLLSEYALVTR